MSNKAQKPLFYMLLFTGIILFIFLIMQPLEIFHFREYIAILFPKGEIGVKQRDLLFIVQAIMLLVIIPVFICTFVFSWKYRAGNPKEEYDPDLIDNIFLEFVWWGVPFVIVVIISLLTWYKTYELDPYKPIKSDKKEMVIQVVALQWKWLFIYPEEKIATVNFLQFPKDRPLHFEITADAPMNSFWIPELGGQIYAMSKMKTELYLIANEVGDFKGYSANISGEGFSGMHFIARASSEEEYVKWVESVQKSDNKMQWQSYSKLALPSRNQPVITYQLTDYQLFDKILNKYMYPRKE